MITNFEVSESHTLLKLTVPMVFQVDPAVISAASQRTHQINK